MTNISYNLRNIARLINEAYSIIALRDLCFYSFREVHDRHSHATKDELIRYLIAHCERKALIGELLSIIEEDALGKYKEFEGRLWSERETPAASASGPKSGPTLAAAQPNLTLNLSAKPQQAELGDDVVWTTTLHNDGDDSLQNIIVQRGLTLLDNPFGLSIGETRTFTFTTTADRIGEINEQVSVISTTGSGQSLQQEAKAMVQVVEPEPELHPSMIVNINAKPQTVKTDEEVTWSVLLRNNGNDALNHVIVQHGRMLLDNPFPFAAGDSREFTYITTPERAGQHTEKIIAIGSASQGQSIRVEASATVQVDEPPPTPEPQLNLTISLTPEPETVEAGQAVTWTFTLHNSGEEMLQGVTVQHGHILLENPFELAVGERRAFTFTTTPKSAGDKIEKILVTGLTRNGRRVQSEARATIRVNETSSSSQEETPQFILGVLKAEPEAAVLGQEITWALFVTNMDEDILNDVTVKHHQTLLEEPFDLGLAGPWEIYFTTTPESTGPHTESVTFTAQTSQGQTVRGQASCTIEVYPELSESGLLPPPEKILEVLKPFQAENNGNFFLDPEIPENKLRNSRQYNEIPDDEPVLGLIDCTVWGSAKSSILFGQKSLYYNNSGSKGSLPYVEFPQRVFKDARDWMVSLDKDQALNTAAAGWSDTSKTMTALLHALQTLIIQSQE